MVLHTIIEPRDSLLVYWQIVLIYTIQKLLFLDISYSGHWIEESFEIGLVENNEQRWTGNAWHSESNKLWFVFLATDFVHTEILAINKENPTWYVIYPGFYSETIAELIWRCLMAHSQVKDLQTVSSCSHPIFFIAFFFL